MHEDTSLKVSLAALTGKKEEDKVGGPRLSGIAVAVFKHRGYALVRGEDCNTWFTHVTDLEASMSSVVWLSARL